MVGIYMNPRRNMDEQQSLEIGAYIRARREDASLSTRELASRVGVDMAQIVRLEQGKVASPRADLLGRIADELKIPASDLMTMAGYPTPRALPNLRPYMRAKYRDLPPEALDDIEAYITKLQAEHGASGPVNGEDET
jgi:transcriptional regulator with XRE-family HTH domain